jgi:hypothetical protein
MAIHFNCPCGKGLPVGEECAGQRARWPVCGLVLDIPSHEPPTVLAGRSPVGRESSGPAVFLVRSSCRLPTPGRLDAGGRHRLR